MFAQLRKGKLSSISSFFLVVVGILYVVLIGVGISTADKATGKISNDIKILMELVTILSALVLLLFSASLFHEEKTDRNIWFLLGLVFMSVMTGLTCAVHFVSITVADRVIALDPSLEKIFILDWPSLLFSIDILAWDFFFGLSFVSLGMGCLGEKRNKVAGLLMILSGVLSLAGLIAIPLNNMNVRFIGVFGYTLLPVAACLSYMIERRRTISAGKGQ